jgi:hypothetical protein
VFERQHLQPLLLYGGFTNKRDLFYTTRAAPLLSCDEYGNASSPCAFANVDAPLMSKPAFHVYRGVVHALQRPLR